VRLDSQEDTTKSEDDMNDETYTKVVKFLMAHTDHRYCEDGFYACPKSEEYFGIFSEIPIERRKCDCYAEEAQALLKEMGVKI
jgi:hypothetical protein